MKKLLFLGFSIALFWSTEIFGETEKLHPYELTVRDCNDVDSEVNFKFWTKKKSGVIEIYQGKSVNTVYFGVNVTDAFTCTILDGKKKIYFASSNAGFTTYTIDTRSYLAGTYQITVHLGNGATYTASFTI